MSSAILYLAIVAIWAGVLIPRWLRRDTSASEQVIDETATPDDAPRPRADDAPRSRQQGRPGVPVARPARVGEARADSARPKDGRLLHHAPAQAGADGDHHASGDQEHARVLSARRRLLGLLGLLTMGSAALAVTRTAAWWVIVPPSVMLLGYLALLREASKADAERRELALARAAEAAIQAEAPPVPVPAPDAEIIEFSAAQSITAAQDAEQDQEFYDQYADAKLRAVGDLART